MSKKSTEAGALAMANNIGENGIQYADLTEVQRKLGAGCLTIIVSHVEAIIAAALPHLEIEAQQAYEAETLSTAEMARRICELARDKALLLEKGEKLIRWVESNRHDHEEIRDHNGRLKDTGIWAGFYTEVRGIQRRDTAKPAAGLKEVSHQIGDRVMVLHNIPLGNLIGTVTAIHYNTYEVSLDGGGKDNMFGFQLQPLPDLKEENAEAIRAQTIPNQ